MNRFKNLLLDVNSNRQSRMNRTKLPSAHGSRSYGQSIWRCLRRPVDRIVLSIVAVCTLATISLAQSSETLKELARVRNAPAKYHELSQALRDGYVNLDLFVSDQGFHYLNPKLRDDRKFELDKLELSVYAPNSQDVLRLVAVEYALRTDQSPDVPEGFSGDNDYCHIVPDFGLWVLRAWAG